LEGLPAVIIGILVLFVLTDRPQQARWLDPAEREWIAARLQREKLQLPGLTHLLQCRSV